MGSVAPTMIYKPNPIPKSADTTMEMTNPTLAMKSAMAIKIDDIPNLSNFAKKLIHKELAPYIMNTRYRNKKPLWRLCKCGKNGQCLCYAELLRKEMIDEFWGREEDFQTMGDLCRQWTPS